MKKISFILLSLLGVSFFGQAKVLTVSNNSNSPGQYIDLQLACDAAAINDTIYIHASNIIYGADIKKSLTLIGEGTLPDKQNLLTTKCNLNFSKTDQIISASGTKIIGIHGVFKLANPEGLSNILFDRCRGSIEYATYSITYKNILISHFVGSISVNLTNSIISNSIINFLAVLSNESSSNLITHSLILDADTYLNGFNVKNSIFYSMDKTKSTPIDFRNCTLENNLFFTSNLPVILNGVNNKLSVDPKFLSPEFGAVLITYNNETVEPKADFKVLSDSPVLTMGTDGKEIGIYGGENPWVDGGNGVFRYHTMPNQVPHITHMDILNTSVPLNGNLKVSIKAKVQQ